MSAISEAQKLLQGPVVDLLSIEHSTAGNFYYTTSSRDPLVSIDFGGTSYVARGFELGGLVVRTTGPLPRPVLAVDNVDRLWFSLIQDHSELIGAAVTYREVYLTHTDSGATPDSSQVITRAEYVIRSMNKISSRLVEFQLATPLDVEQVKIGRTMLRHVCSRSYRVPTATSGQFIDVTDLDEIVDCPYVGSSYYTKDGVVTTDWKKDDCGQRLTDCKLRFGETSPLPIQAFPSIGNPNA